MSTTGKIKQQKDALLTLWRKQTQKAQYELQQLKHLALCGTLQRERTG
jgi:hypothetical protein